MKKVQPWQKLSTKRILDHQLLSIDEDTVELPNGEKSIYVLHTPTTLHSVIVIAINEADQILVQREYSYPPNEIMWQLPGGAMEEGEDVLEAANRELAEESGFRARKLHDIGFFYVNNRKSNRKQFVIVCEDLEEYKLDEDEDEFIETHWLSVPDIRKMIVNGDFVNINLLAAVSMWFHKEYDV